MQQIFNKVTKAEMDLLKEAMMHMWKTGNTFLKMVVESKETDQELIQSIRNRISFAEHALAEFNLKSKS